MDELDRRGIVEYRRIQRVEPRDMPAVYTAPDIVIDQFTMGLYGVAACEAMAAGRVVVSFVGDTVRARARAMTGHELPIVEATPAPWSRWSRRSSTTATPARDVAAAGPSFVVENHDGRRSAAALAPFLTGARTWLTGGAGSRHRVRPRVVMIAGNDIIPDVRVLKYAHTVAGFGLEVIAVGIGGPRLTGERTIGEVRLICPPVTDERRSAAGGTGFGGQALVLRGRGTYRRSLARWEYASREFAALAGREARDARREGVADGPAGRVVGRGGRLRYARGAARQVLRVRARPIRWARNSSSTGTGPGRANGGSAPTVHSGWPAGGRSCPRRSISSSPWARSSTSSRRT